MKKLAILSTHPIQYNAPFFRLLAELKGPELNIFYTWEKGQGKKHDPGFGKEVEWDIPLLEGYAHTFVRNTSKDPGSHHFKGIICPELIGEIEKFAPDAILVYGWNFHAHLKVLRHFKGKIPLWFRGDSTLLDFPVQSFSELFQHPAAFRSWFSFRLRTVVLSLVFRKVDIAFYCGKANKEYFLHHGLRENQLVYMPHAVDNEFFRNQHDEKERAAQDWRASIGIPPGAFVILFAGKLEEKKDPLLLLQAFLELHTETHQSLSGNEHGIQHSDPINKSLHLLFVGSGPLEEKLHQLARDNPRIHFLPFQNQSKMPLVYRLGDLFCLPSKGPGETWGLAVNEALASGRPVLVSDRVGCAGDLVKSQITGEVFTTGDEKELKEKILYILNNRNQYTPYRLQDYISQYSLTRCVEAIESMV